MFGRSTWRTWKKSCFQHVYLLVPGMAVLTLLVFVVEIAEGTPSEKRLSRTWRLGHVLRVDVWMDMSCLDGCAFFCH